MGHNHYQVLGVKEDEGPDGIKKAYRRLSKKYHPDANPGDRAAGQRFKEISEAYAILQDKGKRAAYDRELRGKRPERVTGAGGGKGPRPGPGSGPAGMGFGDMSGSFEQFFGFNPKTGETNKEKMKTEKKTTTGPLDMAGMFERYMGSTVKKK